MLTDNAEAVRSAMGRLIARGHRRIAIIAGPKAVLTAQERLAGYLRALDEHGILPPTGCAGFSGSGQRD